ncbi:MAG: DinB family protein [Planctomycetes bacterium]|nr:DinB family protein [Planctomycetota bacterium]
MLPTLAPIAHLFGLNLWALDRCVGDFQPSDGLVRDPAGHDARWIAGHLTVYRRRLVAMMGLPPLSDAWDTAFQKGTTPDAVPTELDGAQIVRAFHDAHGVMAPRWEALTEADLAKPLGRTLPDGGNTIGAGLRFLLWHETYHLGQLGLLRRLAGKPGIA